MSHALVAARHRVPTFTGVWTQPLAPSQRPMRHARPHVAGNNPSQWASLRVQTPVIGAGPVVQPRVQHPGASGLKSQDSPASTVPSPHVGDVRVPVTASDTVSQKIGLPMAKLKRIVPAKVLPLGSKVPVIESVLPPFSRPHPASPETLKTPDVASIDPVSGYGNPPVSKGLLRFWTYALRSVPERWTLTWTASVPNGKTGLANTTVQAPLGSTSARARRATQQSMASSGTRARNPFPPGMSGLPSRADFRIVSSDL